MEYLPTLGMYRQDEKRACGIWNNRPLAPVCSTVFASLANDPTGDALKHMFTGLIGSGEASASHQSRKRTVISGGLLRKTAETLRHASSSSLFTDTLTRPRANINKDTGSRACDARSSRPRRSFTQVR